MSLKVNDTSHYYEVVRRPLLTEKVVTAQEKANSYGFEVHKAANKIQVRQAIEALYDVKVDKVRTLNQRGKARRLGWRMGRRPDWKKAIVTLKEGHKIELL